MTRGATCAAPLETRRLVPDIHGDFVPYGPAAPSAAQTHMHPHAA